MPRVVWIDVLLLGLITNFVFDYLLLWATAEVSRTPSDRRKLAVGAALGTVYFLAYVLAEGGVLPFYGLLRFIPTVLLVSGGMLALAFRPIPWRRLLTVAGYFYLIGFAAAGAGLASAFWAGSPQQPHVFVGFLVAMATILALAELGWGVVQRRIWQHVYQLPVEVRFGQRRLRLTALVDTGNRLRDPLSGYPVMVAEAATLAPLLPEGVREMVAARGGAHLEAIAQILADSGWSSRFRIIPYKSIDREHGMLIGFRPDELIIHTGSDTIATRHAVVGLCDRQLDPEGGYQALIHPEIIQRGLSSDPAAAAGHPWPRAATETRQERSSAPHASTNAPL